jgi:hypothetical protein
MIRRQIEEGFEVIGTVDPEIPRYESGVRLSPRWPKG